MNTKQIIDDIIAARPRRKLKKPFKRAHWGGYRRLGGFSVRELTAAEVLELQSHVDRCVEAKL